MQGASHGIRAIVRLQTPPEYDPRTGTVRPGALYGFDSIEKGGPADDLLALTTSKRLREPCGRFSLTFTPREPLAGCTWADLIPGYSLVEIWLQRYPQNPAPVLVMLGLTDARLECESYGQAEPERSIQVTGRELSCLFVDQKTLYLPVGPDQLPAAPVLTEEIAHAEGLPALFTSAAQLLGMIAIDPQLVFEGESPVDAIKHFVDMVTVGTQTPFNPQGLPLLNFEFPDAQLKDLLFFDAEKAVSQLFDPQAQLPAAGQIITTGIALWNLMSAWSDPAYQELFTETRDLRAASLGVAAGPPPTRTLASVEILFRKKPFAGRINAEGQLVEVRAAVGSQFDAHFEADPRENVAIGDNDVISVSLSRSVGGLTNVYYVFPQVPGTNSPDDFRARFAPLMDAAESAPSSVRRYGLRLRDVHDYYFRAANSQVDVEIATARARLLWAWHRFEPLFRTGRYTLKGNPSVRVGTRLVHTGRNVHREYYVTGITHSFALGQQPTFLSTLDVERGWPLLN